MRLMMAWAMMGEMMEPLLLFLNFLQYLPAGIALCWAYEQADSIFAPILIHTAINLLAMVAMR